MGGALLVVVCLGRGVERQYLMIVVALVEQAMTPHFGESVELTVGMTLWMGVC